MFTSRSPFVPLVIAVLATVLLAAAARADSDVSNDLQTPIAALPGEEAPMLDGASAVNTAVDLGDVSTAIALELAGEFTVPIELTPWAAADVSLVVEQVGFVRVLDSDATVLVDVSDRIRFEGEQGLLGAAVHPEQPYLYVHYIDLDGATVLAEFVLDADAKTADPDSFREVLTIEQPFDNHNGGEVDFGPDGYLYLGLGDGGLANDPERLALDLTSPLGKILRIDPVATDTEPYTIPSDNPFVDSGDAGVDERIWSYGLRNPWKFSFDPVNGDLWIADVGQNEFEEINVATAGEAHTAGRGVSFGWSAFEGDEPFNDDQIDAYNDIDHHDPFFTTSHADGNCSISGGAVYRGDAAPSLTGWYVFGDYCTGVISAIPTNGNDISSVDLGRVEALVGVAEGVDGELYALSAMGAIQQLSTPGAP